MVTTRNDPESLFDRWYRAPLLMLETALPEGDGGCVVLATCCFLYERYARALLKDNNKEATTEAVIGQLALDFDITTEEAQIFWDVVRNGFLHQGMPKQGGQADSKPPKWRTQHSFDRPIQVTDDPPRGELRTQTWRIRDRVLELYKQRPDLIAYNKKSFPWAEIVDDV